MVDDAAPAEARRDRLLRAVTDRGFIRVTDAAAELGVSGVTVRSDLAALEAAGSIVRVHGGAMPQSTGASESSFESSLETEAQAKRSIGRRAAGLVSSGQSILLDVGTTALAVAHALVDRRELEDVTIVTNGLTIALALEAAMPRFTVVVTGGTLRPLQHSLVNPFASPFLESLNVDLAFIGCNGVDLERGVTNVNLPEAEVKRRMVLAATRPVLIADASKIGRVRLGKVGAISDFDSLVTAADAPADVVGRLRAAGLTVLLAD
jgi:DeoR family transcriptional regulator of aga operon